MDRDASIISDDEFYEQMMNITIKELEPSELCTIHDLIM